MTDTELRTAFCEHKDPVFRFAWRMTGSAGAAEDVVQDCFVQLLSHPDRFDRARGTLRSFLFGIARNRILKQWRGERRWDPIEEDTFVVEPLDPARYETADMVASAVQSLPPLQREVLVMAEYEDCSLEEIARAVEAEIGTVKSRLHRARENLRRMLAPLRNQPVGVKDGTAQ